MEKQNVNGLKPESSIPVGNYSVIVNSKCADEDGYSTVILLKSVSLEFAVSSALNFRKFLCCPILYVVPDVCVSCFESSYTLKILKDEK